MKEREKESINRPLPFLLLFLSSSLSLSLSTALRLMWSRDHSVRQHCASAVSFADPHANSGESLSSLFSRPSCFDLTTPLPALPPLTTHPHIHTHTKHTHSYTHTPTFPPFQATLPDLPGTPTNAAAATAAAANEALKGTPTMQQRLQHFEALMDKAMAEVRAARRRGRRDDLQ